MELEAAVPAHKSADDVRLRNIFFALALATAALGSFMLFVVTPSDRDKLQSLIHDTQKAVPFIGGTLALIGAVWLFIDVFEVHKTVYDRYFVKWQYRHEVDFILPRVLGPFAASLGDLSPQFFREHRELLMGKLFLPWVTGSAPKVGHAFVREFRKALSLYWMSQQLELALILYLLAIYGYAAVLQLRQIGTTADLGRLVWPLFLVQLFGIVNQLF